ncbi:MAG TPA: cellulose biosynthesis cyclic di-GMP-binding regulatory protein BcsB, partial [Armatimonadota bacterium]|nr:cellulose biosynthesis cyclic di-GMP-binding regulatory protein BcsB [Armatimonadota bacterium]
MLQYCSITGRGALLLALLVLSLASAFAQSGTIHYEVPLFREEQALTDPINQRSYWFKLLPGVRLTDNPVLRLHYTYSETILIHQASMAVYVNAIPVAARAFAGLSKGLVAWDVGIPRGLLRPGFNEIRIVTRQRSIEGLCRDVDNDANWVRLAKTSTLGITRAALPQYPLNCYPFPPLDYLAEDSANGVWVLPPHPTPRDVRTLLETASDWGLREPLARITPFVTTHLPRAGNAVVFGRYDQWPELIPASLPAEASKPGAGWLSSRGSDGAIRLLISGQDDAGVDKAARLVTDPDAVEQLHLQEVVIPAGQEVPPRPVVTHKANYYTFATLGAPKISLNGAFHQSTSVTLPRPVREVIGRESFLKIYFRHSATLNPRRSLLTVTVNGRKVGSTPLNAANAQGGILTIPMPVQELDADQWTIGLYAFHDLGTLDCSKKYDEVAWTVVEGHSHVMLMPGKVPGYPSLANFPYAMTNIGRPATPITLWLPARPSDAMLSAAAAIAVRAGQTNRVPLRWDVVMGDTLPGKSKGQVVIMMGLRDDTRRFNEVKDLLYITPTAEGYTTKQKIGAVPGSWKEPAILQASETNWKKQGVLYSVIGAGDAAFTRLARALPLPDTLSKLGAQVAVFTREGNVFAFTTVDPEVRRRLIEQEQNRYTIPMKFVIAGIILAVVLLAANLIALLRRRP